MQIPCSFLNFQFIHLLIQLLWSHGLMEYNLLLLLFILMLTYPIFGQWELIQAGFYVLLTYCHHSLSIFSFILGGGTHYSEIIFSCPRSEIAIFPRSLDSFQWKMVFSNQDLNERCAHCCQGIAAAHRPSQQVNSVSSLLPPPHPRGTLSALLML